MTGQPLPLVNREPFAIVALLLTASVLTACSGAPAATTPVSSPIAVVTPGSAPPVATATRPPTPTQAVATTSAAIPTGATSPTPTVSQTGDLESVIPDEVAGMTLEKTSQSGRAYFDFVESASPDAAEQLEDFLTGLGGSVDDMSLASGSGFGEGDYVNITASRVAGADTQAFLDSMVQFTIDTAPEFNSGMSGSAAPTSLGGKNVTLVTVMLGGFEYSKEYYYGSGDVVFRVGGGKEETIAEALSLLP